jgi:1,4-dihydroxy-6-naphthoate synthase
VFDEVAGLVEAGSVAGGVLIHEGRFTFEERGLTLVQDLGQWWELRFGLPLPLGVILIRRDLGPELGREAERAVAASLARARENPEAGWPYIREQAQELDDGVIRRHIDTFVTEFSDDLGEEGLRALAVLLSASGWSGEAGDLLI